MDPDADTAGTTGSVQPFNKQNVQFQIRQGLKSGNSPAEQMNPKWAEAKYKQQQISKGHKVFEKGKGETLGRRHTSKPKGNGN